MKRFDAATMHEGGRAPWRATGSPEAWRAHAFIAVLNGLADGDIDLLYRQRATSLVP